MRERDKQLKSNQKRNFDNHHGARNLDSLSTGQLVWVSDARVETRVEEQVAPRSYTINTPGGQIRQNRQDLIPFPTEPATPTDDLLETRSSTKRSSDVADEPLRRSSRLPHPPNRLISDPTWN